MTSALDPRLLYSVFVVGLLFTGLANWAIVGARRRAAARYRAILGPDHEDDGAMDKSWGEMRAEIGVWGCALVALRLLRGAGLLATALSGLCLLLP